MRFSTFRRFGGLTSTLAWGLALAALVGPLAVANPQEKLAPVVVRIDILPGDPSDVIVLGARGSVPVAILGSVELDVTMLDPATINVAGWQTDKERVTLADVSGDGILDLVVRVPRRHLILQEGPVELTVRGAMTDGRPITGTAGATAAQSAPDLPKQAPVQVQIDILPGDGSNLIAAGASNAIPVAIMSTESFDASTINVDMVELAGAPVAENKQGEAEASHVDLDGDGRLDLVVGVDRTLLRLPAGATSATLRGRTFPGLVFEGSDTVVGPGAEPETSTLAPAATATFSNPAPITIPAGAPATTSGPAAPYPSPIAVAGLPGVVQRVTVRLNSLGHTWPQDVDILLVGPGGQNLIVMSDVGGTTVVTGVTLTLDDLATASIPTTTVATGTFRPTNSGTGDTFAAPAPVPSAATQLAVFNGTNPNGTWNLFVVDDAAGDVGSFAGGWSITISTSVTTVCFTSAITIPDSGPASPYPASIAVAGLLGTVTATTVDLNSLSHTFPDDIDVLLSGPSGANAIIMSDVGGGFPGASGVTLTLDDAAGGPMPDSGPLVSGSFQPTNVGAGDAFPGPAPAPGGGSALSVFNGASPNGSWDLWVVDDLGGDVGSFGGGWCLTVTTTACGGTAVCDDGNPCTDDTCNLATGLCQFVNDNTNTCTADANPCTDDVCQNGTCVAVNDNTNTCSDGNPCTRDACQNGACVPTGNIAKTTFSGGAIAIPAVGTSGIAAPYPSTIVVPPTPLIQSLEMSVSGYTHTFPDDVDVLLVGPTTQNLIVMSDVGGSLDVVGVNLTLSDAAATSLPDATQIVSGTFKPTNIGAGDTFPAPAPVASAATTLAVYNGTNPTGAWSLFVNDDLGGDSGSFSGWSLGITVDCNDNNACTTEGCNATGCTYTPVNCDDGNPCTTDSCDPVQGCRNLNNTIPCDDATVCNGREVCGGGTCNPGTPLDCNDGNPCTTDSCDPVQGCQNVNSTIPCDDTTVCNGREVCGGGTCNPGTPLDCNDGNPCTDDSCDPVDGCQNDNNTDTCDDSTVCNGREVCGGGSCNPGTPLNCDDGNPCTTDSCDPVDGCQNDNNTDTCDDTTVCNGREVCGGGTCNPGTPLNCDDGNPCTDDSCDPVQGCQSVNDDTNACSDQNACTTGDHCLGGACVGGPPLCCDDGNVCTDDSCVPASGCVNACNNECNSKGHGYWKKLCKNQGGEEPCGLPDDHGDDHGEFYTQKDIDCVNDSCTFSDVQTIAQMCAVLDDHNGDRCSKAERKFMSLLLNVCRCRVNAGQTADSRCGGPPQTVAQRIAATDATLCNPGRTEDDCRHPECTSEELINGEALWQNSLQVQRQGTGVRLTWNAVYGNPVSEAPRKYRLWRRQLGGPYTMIGEVNSNTFTFLDTTSGPGSYWYEVTATY